MRELKAILADIDAAVLPGPKVNWAELQPMQRAGFIGGNVMVGAVSVQRSLPSKLQRLRFSLIHVAHPRDPEQISQHTAARTRLELRLGACNVILTGHALSPATLNTPNPRGRRAIDSGSAYRVPISA